MSVLDQFGVNRYGAFVIAEDIGGEFHQLLTLDDLDPTDKDQVVEDVTEWIEADVGVTIKEVRLVSYQLTDEGPIVLGK